MIGVRPDLQRRGAGSALMNAALEQCDRDRIPAYLESSLERNLPFYERHGFETIEQVDVPGGGPHLWLMWREPA